MQYLRRKYKPVKMAAKDTRMDIATMAKVGKAVSKSTGGKIGKVSVDELLKEVEDVGKVDLIDVYEEARDVGVSSAVGLDGSSVVSDKEVVSVVSEVVAGLSVTVDGVSELVSGASDVGSGSSDVGSVSVFSVVGSSSSVVDVKSSFGSSEVVFIKISASAFPESSSLTAE